MTFTFLYFQKERCKILSVETTRVLISSINEVPHSLPHRLTRSPPIGWAGKRRANKIGPKAAGGDIFCLFSNFDNRRPEAAGDVISRVAED